METSLPTLVGLVAGAMSTYSFVPQVTKCWTTGNTEAISLRMFAVRAFGLLLWTIYGFAAGSLPVLIFSALGLVLSSIVLVLKIRRPAAQGTGVAPHSIGPSLSRGATGSDDPVDAQIRTCSGSPHGTKDHHAS